MLSLAVLAGASTLSASRQATAALTVAVTDTPAASTGENGNKYDLYSFYLTGLSGADLTGGTLGTSGALIGLSGDFSDSTANGLWVPGGPSTDAYAPWSKFISNGGEQSALAISGGIYDSSFVNLDTVLTPLYDGTNGSETNSGTHHTVTAISGNATNFNASWGAISGAGIVPGPVVGSSTNNLIAQVYALPGTKVTFTGFYTTYGTNSGVETFSSGGTTSSSSSSAQPIISLLTTAPTSYASQLGSTIALTYTGPGGYVPGSTTFSALSKGYGVVTGFHTPDTEIYALDVLNASGGALTSAQISAVVSDINASESGVTASLVTGVYSKLFPGYDVLLTGTTPATTGTSYYLGIDFSATGDQDPATQGFTVGAIAAVPEPATMAGLVLGASGLLLGRRKNRAVAA